MNTNNINYLQEWLTGDMKILALELMYLQIHYEGVVDFGENVLFVHDVVYLLQADYVGHR